MTNWNKNSKQRNRSRKRITGGDISGYLNDLSSGVISDACRLISQDFGVTTEYLFTRRISCARHGQMAFDVSSEGTHRKPRTRPCKGLINTNQRTPPTYPLSPWKHLFENCRWKYSDISNFIKGWAMRPFPCLGHMLTGCGFCRHGGNLCFFSRVEVGVISDIIVWSAA